MKPKKETCMPKCVQTKVDQLAARTWAKPELRRLDLVRLARAGARLAMRAPSLAMVFSLLVALGEARGGDALRPADAGCRVTGVVLSTKAETKAQPAENQFRMRVVGSPWEWQVGTSMPVTSTMPHSLKDGDSVEVLCDFARPTRKGRFSGEARKIEAATVAGGGAISHGQARRLIGKWSPQDCAAAQIRDCQEPTPGGRLSPAAAEREQAPLLRGRTDRFGESEAG